MDIFRNLPERAPHAKASLLGLPIEIQTKIKYFVIEHPVARIFKDNVEINIKK